MLGVYAQPSRVTIYLPDGTTPVRRWTFPAPKNAGRELKWVLEAKLTTGCLPERKQFLNANGFRPVLTVKWDVDTGSSPTPTQWRGAMLENWTGTAWTPDSYQSILYAVKDIQSNSNGIAPVLVEPYSGFGPWTPFLARSFEPIVTEEDVKGILHVNVTLLLRGTKTVATPLDFALMQFADGWATGFYVERP